MKDVDMIKKEFFATLAELQSGTTLSKPFLDMTLRVKLQTLWELLIYTFEEDMTDWDEQFDVEENKLFSRYAKM